MKWARRFWILSFEDVKVRIALHVVFWLIFCFYLRADSTSVIFSIELPIWVTLSGILLHIVLFYPLIYGIIPLIIRRKWILAVVCIVVFYVGGTTLQQYHIRSLLQWVNKGTILQFDGQHLWDDLWDRESDVFTKIRSALNVLLNLVTIIFIPLSIKLLRNLWRATLRQTELSKRNAQLQLSVLKGQINPHMFFNTLNNLQSFIIHDEKVKSVSLLTRLADFMRVSLYEVDAEWIPLEKEIQLMENYVGIQRVRFDDNSKISVDIQTDGGSQCKIPPLLLLPFVENAFKYSSSLRAEEVCILLQVHSSSDKIHFRISNKYSQESGVEPGGMGLSNVMRRIELYYPLHHSLKILNESCLYTVDLIIPCR